MITNENLKTIIEEVIGNNDLYLNTQVYDIVKRIIDLPNETTTTIADLINYNPKLKFVEPLKQGEINYFVKETCKKLNIELEKNDDSFGGLAYYYQFKKVNKDKVESYMESFINKPVSELSEEEKEFEKYCKLYEEKFGNKVTIPEQSGTKEFVIECIKKCLQENRDILGDLCYPNFKKDMENGVLYSEQNIANIDELSNSDTLEQNDNSSNNDKLIWKEGEIKIAKTQCELCKYNNEENKNFCIKYPNGKPIEVLNNERRCSEFKNENGIEL